MPRRRGRLELSDAAPRRARGRDAERAGREAEDHAAAWLASRGWEVFARRLRSAAGEIDIAAERKGVVAIVEVKRRASLATAAASVSARQQARLMVAAELLLARFPERGTKGVRFDVVVVDDEGRVQIIEDAFRRI